MVCQFMVNKAGGVCDFIQVLISGKVSWGRWLGIKKGKVFRKEREWVFLMMNERSRCLSLIIEMMSDEGRRQGVK